MPDNDHQQLDRELGAALAKYAAVEPRAGLEERVLANLRAEQASPGHAWWRWSIAGALAAVAIVAVALAWRSGRPSHPAVAGQSSSAKQGQKNPEPQSVPNGSGNQPHAEEPWRTRRTNVHRSQPNIEMAAGPKLSQFPSPHALSEQEKILRDYVAQYPEQAVLLARARTDAIRRDQLEEMRASPSDDQPSDSEERNGNTTER